MRIGSLRLWKPLVRASQMAGVLLLTTGWSGSLRPPAEHMPHPQLIEQSRRMNARYDAEIIKHEDRLSIDLDLADDAQHAFVVDRLRAAGKDEKNSPGLFDKLSLFRERALRRQREGAKMDAPSSSPIWCDHYLIVKAPTSSGTGASLTYEPYVRVSCHGGANYVYADLVVYDINKEDTQSRVVASNAGEEYGGGTDFIGVGAVASVDVAQGRLLRLESLALAVDDVTGRDVTSYTVEKTSIALRDDGGFTLLHPREIVPNNNRADIWMCQLRGGADCDYAVAGYDQGSLKAYPPVPQGVAASRAEKPGELNPSDFWELGSPFNATRLYVPIRTEIRAGSSNYLQCTVDHYTYAKVRLHSIVGTCVNTVDLKSLLPVGHNTAVFNYLADVSYDISGTENPNSPCTTTRILNNSVSFNITLIGKARCATAGGTHTLEPFFKSQAIDGRTLTSQRLFFQNSCMAAGTRIQMANGHILPVEQVEIGDKVLANKEGLILTVTDVARGHEIDDFVQLRDNAGHRVTLTQMHPIIKADGKVVAARSLKVRDQVRTERGVSTIKSVKRIPANGKQVFNLALGTPYELREVDSQERTLFAGGFLVGDKSMQDLLQAPPQQPLDVASRLPKTWQQDFANAQTE
ncbi:Hint domain-containing protein [Stigmatella sp. ncwal1]|uniref:Hint domain-containing protein n=1 Tax=Stigmatella ashevillensis TaxID=2995309 RepID=A0ABT5DEW9_9BACT|nr:Hint domain-containing protein [Stigmatella ashevillena]MDC0712214.1 Hint domain-containing protein [Stigmatella ashevillena]